MRNAGITAKFTVDLRPVKHNKEIIGRHFTIATISAPAKGGHRAEVLQPAAYGKVWAEFGGKRYLPARPSWRRDSVTEQRLKRRSAQIIWKKGAVYN